jgi:hypothetical protein
MPTLQEWQQALTVPRQVRVESSPALIGQVQERQLRKNAERQRRGRPIPPSKTAIIPVAAFAPETVVPIAPAYLLHRLGVVTTPPVENLADICSTWAYLRYLWAFEIPPPGAVNAALCLSDAAREIDFHQKSLLSDQIGVGMAAVLLGTHMQAPLAADVSVAMNDPSWPIDFQDDTSPDYLFFDSAQATIFIVECKGTQTTRAASVDQLRRGAEQVPSLTFTDGRRPPAIVVATLLSRQGTQVFIIDPPEDEEMSSDFPDRPERVGKREWRVRNDAEFTRSTRLISEAKTLSFAGADEAADSKLERAHARDQGTPRSMPRQTEITENEFGRFRGARQRVAMKDRLNVEVFQALDTSVYEAMLSEEPQRTTEEIRTFQSRAASMTADLSQPVATTRERDVLVVRSAGPDGTLLEVRVSPP